MDYLLKASGIVVILFLFYIIFLKNETFFKSIRGYFLIGLIIAVSIPLIEIPVYIETVSNQISQLNYNNLTTYSNVLENTFDWIQFLTFTYLVGVTIFSLKFLIQLFSLAFLLSKNTLNKKGNYYFIETTKEISPFSFFNIIIYNKEQFTRNELEQIINHEKAHVLQWHSLDTILAHLLVITLWFNPFVWLYKKAVQQNLEFLADSYAIQLSKNQKLYQFTLLKTCGANYCTEITNNFYNSLIKKRIIMIHKSKSNNKSQWKYILLIPIFLAFVMTFNTKIVAQEKKLIEVEELIMDLIINKSSSDASLTQEAANFKNETNINLSFKGIKRNSNDEITAIKIDAKGDDLKASFQNSGNESIQPIKIAYDSKNNSISIGNLQEVHENHFSYTIHDKDTNIERKPHNVEKYVMVTSDGNTTSWTTKDTIIQENKVIIKSHGDEEHVWLSTDAHDGNVKIEVIEVKDVERIINMTKGDDIENTTIEIIKSEDGKTKNIHIIKDDGHKTIEHGAKKVMFLRDGEDGEPIIFLDGKEISKEEMEKMDTNSFESISVLKGESATKKYGEKGKNEVIVITKKKQ